MKKIINIISILAFVLGLCFNWISCSAESSSSDLGLILLGKNGENTKGNSNTENSPEGSQLDNLNTYWYKSTNFYHIWVKSFSDSNSDGIGDLNGVKNKLDYIKNTLGCDGIWLSPIFECNYKDYNMHGYDTTDYYAVNSKFGTKEDLAALINDCHSKGIKIIFDFVPNHTSSANQWFTRSVNKETVNGVDYTDWYVWSATEKSVTTNMSSSKYYLNSTRGEYYYGAFGGKMPDLNFSNSAVRAELLKIIKYWMDFGFDGMRADAVRYLYDDVTGSNYMDTTKSHEIFAEWRALLNSYSVPKFMMCEAWIEDNRDTLESYLGTNAAPEFNMVLDFFQGRPCYKSVKESSDSFVLGWSFKANSASSVTGAGYASFLTNHDLYTDRIGTVFNGDQLAMSESTALSLMRPNVSIIYYGQELGAKNTSDDGDTALRGNFDWTEEAAQAENATSILKLNKALLTVRNTYKSAFANGTLAKLTSSDNKKLAYTITDGSTKILCIYNLSDSGAATTTFTDSSLGTVTNNSTLIGEATDSTLTVSSGTVTVTNLAPYAYRVYLIGDATAQNLYDNETYSANHSINYRTYYENMYLTGSMNSWGAEAMTPDENHSIFTINKSLTAGTYIFKFRVSNSTWVCKNWGAAYEISYPADSVFTATGDKNLKVIIPTDGTYTIKFDSYCGIVTVLSDGTSENTAKNNIVYLRGSFSSWNDYKGLAMVKQSNGTYAITFTPIAGTYDFKISRASDSWDDQWGAASSLPVSLGVATATSTLGTSGNFKVTLESSATTIMLDPVSNTVTVSQ